MAVVLLRESIVYLEKNPLQPDPDGYEYFAKCFINKEEYYIYHVYCEITDDLIKTILDRIEYEQINDKNLEKYFEEKYSTSLIKYKAFIYKNKCSIMF